MWAGRLLLCLTSRVPTMPPQLHLSSGVAAALAQAKPLAHSTPRCPHDDPALHTAEHVGQFYTIREKDFRVVQDYLKAAHRRQLNAFGDLSLMIRRPAVEVVGCLSHLGAGPVIRYMLYGASGTGISTQMAQIAHYAYRRGWLVVNFPEAYRWLRDPKELTVNQHSPDLFDFPNEAISWLKRFLHVNEELLSKHRPQTLRPIQWNQKESMPLGTPWSDLVAFALSRPKYATDCFGIMLREIREHSNRGQLTTLVTADTVNFLWAQRTRLKAPSTGQRLTVDNLSAVHYLRRLLRNDWTNGAIVCSVSERGTWSDLHDHHTPRYLLTETGFKWMDPFVPVEVGAYTGREVDCYLRYLADNGWLTHPTAMEGDMPGRKQIAFLACGNAQELFNVTAEW